MNATTPSSRPWIDEGDRLRLLVRLTPKSARDELVGVERLSDGRAVVKARVRAVPENGNANDALVKVVAKATKVAPSQVSIVAGHQARLKTLIVSGDPGALQAALSARLSARLGETDP